MIIISCCNGKIQTCLTERNVETVNKHCYSCQIYFVYSKSHLHDISVLFTRANKLLIQIVYEVARLFSIEIKPIISDCALCRLILRV